MIKHRPLSKTTQDTIKTAFKLTQLSHLSYKDGQGEIDYYRSFLKTLDRIPDYLYSTYYSSVRNMIKEICNFNSHNEVDLETTLKQIDKILDILINKEI